MFQGINQYTPLAAISAALLLSPIVPLIHIMLMRFSRKNKGALLFMATSFVAYGLLWLFTGFYLNGSASLSFPSIIAGASIVAFVCFGYTEFFFLVCGGFSMRIVMDVYLHDLMTLGQLLESYGGKGMDWMLSNRIERMRLLGIVNFNDGMLEAGKPFGVFMGKAGLFIKNLLKTGEGG